MIPLRAPAPDEERVAFVIGGTTISGGMKVVCEYANALREAGAYVVMLCTGPLSGQMEWFPGQKVPVIPFREAARDWDTVITTFWQTNEFASGLSAKRRVYLVQSDERCFYPRNPYLRLRVAKTYRQKNVEYLCVAAWMKKWLKEEFNQNAELIVNGIDVNAFASAVPLAAKSDRLRVLIEGDANSSVKNIASALEIVRGTDMEIWRVTPAADSAAEEADRVFSAVPASDMPGIYRSCDILLKTSRFESFCLPALEMMAAGGVVLAARTPGTEELIRHGENGFLFEQNDTAAAEKYLDMLRDPEIRERIGRQAAAYAAGCSRDESIRHACSFLLPGQKYKQFFKENTEAGITDEETLRQVFLNMPEAEGTARRIQLCNNDLLRRIKRVCDANGIPFFLLWGTLLGSVRHRGFIPWDDDIDIGMMRQDLLKLKDIIRDDPVLRLDMAYNWGLGGICWKIRYRLCDSFWVDIFLYETFEDDPSEDRAAMIREASARYQHRRLHAVRRYYHTRKPCLATVSDPRVDRLCESARTLLEKELPFLGRGDMLILSPDANPQLAKPPVPYSTFFPLQKNSSPFEGELYDTIREPDLWLKSLYGDYMTLPADITPKHEAESMSRAEEDLKKLADAGLMTF
ncbi:MAG: LicD family protein [Clostridia bacterium]|nr:LicD family protein [Clostridia bacterium]